MKKRAMTAAEVPLVERLERVPLDARLAYEHSPIEHSFFPVGLMCHEAAKHIRELTAERDLALMDAKGGHHRWHLACNDYAEAEQRIRELEAQVERLRERMNYVYRMADPEYLGVPGPRSHGGTESDSYRQQMDAAIDAALKGDTDG